MQKNYNYLSNRSEEQEQNVKNIFRNLRIKFRKIKIYRFSKNSRRTFSHFLENVTMLEASKFSALVVNTIQGFSRKNRTPSSFLNFEIGVPRPKRLVILEIRFAYRA